MTRGARWWRRHGMVVAATAVFGLGTMDLLQHYTVGVGAAILFSVVRAVPLLLHRRPLPAFLLALGAATATAVVTRPLPTEPWPWAVTSVASVAVLAGVLGAGGDRRLSAAGLGLVAVVGAGLAPGHPSRGGWLSVLIMVVCCAVAIVIGDALHGRRAVAEKLTVERDRRWLAEERARIARELHDVVAHNMSMITVQAETARYRLSGLPEPAAEEFAGIARLARGSLTELRTLLSALRGEDGPVDHAPQPDLGNLAELVELTSAAGTPVSLSVAPGEDALRDLPHAVQLSAYRIVQEALSNVVRHARGAPSSVTVELTDSLLRLEIVNDPPERPVEPAQPGHGLRGLRERATLIGGTLEVESPDGGWRVRAVLPVRKP